MICGGSRPYFEQCYKYDNGQWNLAESMKYERGYAASVQYPISEEINGFLVSGGFDGISYFDSSEIFTPEGWQNGLPKLTDKIDAHCMVMINSTSVMVIGGLDGYYGVPNTFIHNKGDDFWTKGPTLKTPRLSHSCGNINRNSQSLQQSVIVVGGYNSGYLASTEILDEGAHEWREGPSLPYGTCCAQSVDDSNGGFILIGGRRDDSTDTTSMFRSTDTTSMFRLPHAGEDAEWEELPQKLKTGRYYSTAFLIPDEIANCPTN